MQHNWKNAAHLKKCGTLGKMRHTWINAPYLTKNPAHLGKIRNIYKNAAHL